MVLSALMFTGGSQFAFFGVIGAGGSGVGAAGCRPTDHRRIHSYGLGPLRRGSTQGGTNGVLGNWHCRLRGLERGAGYHALRTAGRSGAPRWRGWHRGRVRRVPG